MTAPAPAHDDLVLPPPPELELAALRDLVSSSFLNHDPALVQNRAGALFARLKALNRAANHATRAHKQATADARHDMDQTYLGLQNLLYEKRHLEREIDKCRQFASIYQDIPFHALDEFAELAPEEARTDEVLADEHQLMLNRLSFELSERQRELIKEKETLLKESKIKATTMESMKTHIDGLLKSALEAQKKVNDLVESNPLPPSSSPSTPAPS
ncbi:Fms-interacting protein-domain-containing protein [Lenzites betulinus]|nr:Fms-interacting protein-domain-containing protein [Lenzites betulinus]